jgi:hypothetical protein
LCLTNSTTAAVTGLVVSIGWCPAGRGYHRILYKSFVDDWSLVPGWVGGVLAGGGTIAMFDFACWTQLFLPVGLLVVGACFVASWDGVSPLSHMTVEITNHKKSQTCDRCVTKRNHKSQNGDHKIFVISTFCILGRSGNYCILVLFLGFLKSPHFLGLLQFSRNKPVTS